MEESNNKIKMSITKKIILGIVLAVILAIASFIIYEVATVNNTYYIGQKNLQIPIFVYHDLVEDKSQIEYDYMPWTASLSHDDLHEGSLEMKDLQRPSRPVPQASFHNDSYSYVSQR